MKDKGHIKLLINLRQPTVATTLPELCLLTREQITNVYQDDQAINNGHQHPIMKYEDLKVKHSALP